MTVLQAFYRYDRLCAVFFCIYFIVTIYVYYSFNSTGEDAVETNVSEMSAASKLQLLKHALAPNSSNVTNLKVDIWSKASIGLYLWHHILSSPSLTYNEKNLISTGHLNIEGVSFTFRTGPGLVPATAVSNATRLVLVLNGRSEDKVQQAKIWLDSLAAFSSLVHVVLVILGNELCQNEWLWPYMRSRGGHVDICFITYDSPMIDGKEIFQWPLGVATYRGFPSYKGKQLMDQTSKRPFTCNFVATMYENSSRDKLHHRLKQSNFKNKCLIVARKKWQPLETNATLDAYVKSLQYSDLTLSPVGVNTECYRIYEAMEMGSVPVVEDVVTAGDCDRSEAAPLRLLKAYGAPIMYVKQWDNYLGVLRNETRLSYKFKVMRRLNIIKWYAYFQKQMAEMLLRAIISNS